MRVISGYDHRLFFMRYEHVIQQLQQTPKRWLITGVAGFIGSNLLEFLLNNNQLVTGLDNLSTGYLQNLEEVQRTVGKQKWENFYFFQGDICSLSDCCAASEGMDYILHHAALGSVPRSIQDPIATNHVNIDGFLNMLVAAHQANVLNFVYAGSSSTYGDDENLPKMEDRIGAPISPYAVSKYVNELYGAVFSKNYGLNSIGLRYFNVFGKRQNSLGSYAAVIPTWIKAIIKNEIITIYGDGETSRDFCYIDNVIQANILAATADPAAQNQIYNIALNDRTSLNQLFGYLKNALEQHGIHYDQSPIYQAFRSGDMRHSQADIRKATLALGYEPTDRVQMGIEKAIEWYIGHIK